METEEMLGCGAFAVLFIVVLVGSMWFASIKCDAKFDEASLQSRWSIFGGCQVKDPKAGWIPAENYRVL
jgi:hypothetical protein